jgi:two-component sensor histidine kinase
MFIAARQDADSSKCLSESKSILLRELSHAVANNFASVAALITVRSDAISDARTKAVLEEAVEQIRIMGQVHALSQMQSNTPFPTITGEVFAFALKLGRTTNCNFACKMTGLDLLTSRSAIAAWVKS